MCQINSYKIFIFRVFNFPENLACPLWKGNFQGKCSRGSKKLCPLYRGFSMRV